MRSIAVSTDTYSKIWALRQEGEENEDDILRRVLIAIPEHMDSTVSVSGFGFSDARHNVHFPENFKIKRRYLGSEFEAIATSGQWRLLKDGQLYGSLNELSKAIGAKTENAWLNWNFADENGKIRKVGDLRQVRETSSRQQVRHAEAPRARVSIESNQFPQPGSWAADLVEAFVQIHQDEVPLRKIYDEVKKIRVARGLNVPTEFEATVRERLESNSSESDNYKGGIDLFFMPRGKGHGVWSLREDYRQKA